MSPETKYIVLLYIVPAVVLLLLGFLFGKFRPRGPKKKLVILIGSLFFMVWAGEMGFLPPAGKWAASDWIWLCSMVAALWVIGLVGFRIGRPEQTEYGFPETESYKDHE